MKKLLTIASVLITLMLCIAGIPAVSGGIVGNPIPAPGELYSVSLPTTLQGIRACLNGDMGTGIFANPARIDSLIFMWRSSENSWSFVGLNIDPKTMAKDLLALRANYSNIKDYRGIIDALTNTGWSSISYKVVEGSIRNPVLMATINRILDGVSSKFTTFLIMPIGINPSQIGAVDYERISPENSQQ